MQSDALKNFWQHHNWTFNRREGVLVLVSALLLAFIAPYQSANTTPFAGRFAYWACVILFASLVSGPIASLLFPRMIKAGMGAIQGVALYSTALSVPIFVLVLALDILLTGYTAKGTELGWSYVPAYFDALDMTLYSFFYFFLQVWLLVALINGISALIFERFQMPRTQAETAPSAFRFLNRLPASLGQDIICLSMEEHYVRVHTAKGDTLIRMRMRDAVDELDGYEGAQLHRSWWVAFGAIQRISKQGRRYVALLKNGMEAPVSASRVEELKNRGFL